MADDKEDRTANLVRRFGTAIEADPELSNGEIIYAIASIMGDALFSIRCSECRRLAREGINEVVPRILRAAMVEAADRDRDKPPPAPHLH